MFSSKTSPLSITISSCFLDSLTSSPDSPNFGSFGRLVKTSTLIVVFDVFLIDYGFNIKMTACSNTMRTILWIWLYSDMNVRIEKFDINVNTNMTMSLNMNIPCVNLKKKSPTSGASKKFQWTQPIQEAKTEGDHSSKQNPTTSSEVNVETICNDNDGCFVGEISFCDVLRSFWMLFWWIHEAGWWLRHWMDNYFPTLQ